MFEIVWTSQYGTEVVDTADTRKEAKYLRNEYALAFREGTVRVRKVAA